MKKLLLSCFTVFFCICCLASCTLFATHSITYADKETESLLLDGYVPRRANPGDTVVLRAGPIMDADLYFYANGVQIENTHNDSDYWEYTFIMPNEDVIITHDISGDGPIRVVNDILRNQDGCEWLNEITAEDIAKVKIIKGAVGVAPGSLKKIQSSTNETTIKRIFEAFYLGEIIPIPKQDGEIDGGGSVTVKFVLKNGTVNEIYFNNGHYQDVNGNYFDLYIPEFEESDNVSEAYGFITYIGTGTVCDKDYNTVCEIPMDELEFYYGLDLDLPDLPPYDIIVITEFGSLDFISPDIFYMENGEACVLIGKNLDELIAEYSAEKCNHKWDDGVEVESGTGYYVMEYTCLRCGRAKRDTFTIIPPSGESHSITYQGDGTKELLMEGFAPASAKPGDTVVFRTFPLMDADLCFYANGIAIENTHNNSDYWEYVFTMPDEDVVITHGITDGFLPG